MLTTLTTNEIWRQLAPYVKQTILVADRSFYCEAVDRFNIVVLDCEDNKQEAPYQTIIEQRFAEQVIKQPSDLIGFFLHISSHQRCDLFWSKCPIPMSSFTPHQLDFLEEVYNQRLVSIVAPTCYDAFPTVNAEYDVYKQYNILQRKPLQTMFTGSCNTGMEELDKFHMWLYQNDPLQQQTFNAYIYMWAILLGDHKYSSVLARYENISECSAVW